MLSYDVVIIGGAAMGSSVAFHLASDPDFAGRVLVIEKDPTYSACASALSAASIRQQFSTRVNVQISLFGITVLRDLKAYLGSDEAPDIGLVEKSYLYLASSEGAGLLGELNAFQRAEGADTVLMDTAALAQRFPYLSLDGIAAGNWGRSGEGWFDGWGLLQAFRGAARQRGVTYMTGEVVGIERRGGRVTHVVLADGRRIACGALVNCAGARGRQIAAMAGIDIPVQSKRRFVFTFTCKQRLNDMPLIIDTSGVYVRPEGHGSDGQMFICGVSPPPDADPDWDDHDIGANAVDWSLFEETIWPALAARIPAFEAIRPGRAWAGPYDMNMLDHNAIIGRAGLDNIYLCNGFSGHGLQQCPAIGRGLAELIVHGSYRTLDLSDLGFDRIAQGRPLLERNVI